MPSTYMPATGPSSDERAPDEFRRDTWSSDDAEEARDCLQTVLAGRDFRARLGPEPFAFRFASAGTVPSTRVAGRRSVLPARNGRALPSASTRSAYLFRD
jgi:hypothetical protein